MSLEILKKYWIKAKKSLWQNFLVNKDILKTIVNFLNISWEDIIEVWPWYWALTEELLKENLKSLTLIELDKDMIEILKKRIKENDLNIWWINFFIENKDILIFSTELKNYIVIANIPYYITSPILRHFLYELENKPKKMIILMQKDVWDKIMLWNDKSLKSNKTSVLSLIISKKCYVKKIVNVWKQDFIPSPKVDSVVLYFEFHHLYNNINDEIFLDFIKIWFKEPRKKLIKNLTNSWYKKEKLLEIFKTLWLDENVRAEELSLEIWLKLIELLDI